MAVALRSESPAPLEAAPQPSLTVGGVDVTVDLSWAFALALGTWTFAEGLLPAAAAGRDALAYWATGAVAATLVLLSVAVHEAGHCLAARRAGLMVRGVTLSMFGGVTAMAHEPSTPRATVRIALAGPLASLACAAAAAMAHVALVEAGADALLAAALAQVAAANVLVALVNLLPVAPLDGGRVLAGLLATVLGRRRAVSVADAAGRAVGLLLIGVAVLASASGDVTLALWAGLSGLTVADGAVTASDAAAARPRARAALDGRWRGRVARR